MLFRSLSAAANSNIHEGQIAGLRVVTAENFALVFQGFNIGDSHTGYTTGRIVPLSNYGYEIGQIFYEAPRYVLKHSPDFDRTLLVALKRLKRRNPLKYRTIIRATDAMMNGYSNSDDVSFESRILEQARSFEILFALPESGQRKIFKEKISKYCQPINERKIRYKIELRKVKTPETGTRQKMWADRFYTLRNRIIQDRKSTRLNSSHTDITRMPSSA